MGDVQPISTNSTTPVSQQKFVTIRINKNEGLTYGLKSYVDELVKDGKAEKGSINWNKTIDTINEIQTQREKTKEPSIFSGEKVAAGKGTDKSIDWHTSMTVNEGEVKLSENEIKDLLVSMGVALKKDSSEVAPKKVSTAQSKIQGTQPRKNELVTEDKNGQKVKTYSNSVSPKLNYKETYDKDNKMIKREFFKNGTPDGYRAENYNEKGQSTVSKVFDNKNELSQIRKYSYDKNNKLAGRKDYKPDGKNLLGVAANFDQYGNHQTYTNYEKGKIVSIEKRELNEYGDMVKNSTYKADGKTLMQVVSDWDQYGNVAKIILYKSNGKAIDHIEKYENNEKGICLKQYNYTPKNKLFETLIDTDLSNDSWEKKIVYKADGKTVDHYERRDPKNGEWVRAK